MCLTPSYVWVQRGPKWEKESKPCGLCWRCKQNRISDYVGRALCEAAYSEAVATLTLTYAPREDGADKNLTPIHFQAFIRALRKRGHKIRYLAAGEYGKLRDRAHFHVVLFFRSGKPDWPQEENFHMEEWPHGHVFCDWAGDDRAIRYVCKYLLKTERGDGWFSLSKKPVLGWDFFREKAEENIKHGVFPSVFEYVPPNASVKKRYLISGTTRMEYITYIAEGLAGTGRVIPEKLSPWAKKSLDKAFRRQHARYIEKLPVFQRLQAQAEGFEESLDRRRISPYAVSKVLWSTSPECDEWRDEKLRKEISTWLVEGVLALAEGRPVRPPLVPMWWFALAEIMPHKVRAKVKRGDVLVKFRE